MIPKLMGIPYFEACAEGAKNYAAEQGCELIFQGTTNVDASEQVKLIEDYLSQDIDAILIDANDPAALTPTLKKAKEVGILVIDWDSPAEYEVVDYSCLSVDDQAMGEMYYDRLAEVIGTSGDYAIVTGGLTATNLNTWIDIGLEYAKEKYPDLHVVADRIPSEESSDVAYQRTLEIIKTYPEIKGIIAYSSTATPGVAQAIADEGLSDKIQVVGGTMPSEVDTLIEEGALDACITWNPERFGYFCAAVAIAALKGEAITDGMTLGGMEGVIVNDKLVTMPTAETKNITKDNLKDNLF
jgi:simple sugar transport system substrate-binding protein/rhamnose transport system substrate-binding protein